MFRFFLFFRGSSDHSVMRTRIPVWPQTPSPRALTNCSPSSSLRRPLGTGRPPDQETCRKNQHIYSFIKTELVQLRCHKKFTDTHGITATSWISECVSKRASNSAGGTCPYTSYISDTKDARNTLALFGCLRSWPLLAGTDPTLCKLLRARSAPAAPGLVPGHGTPVLNTGVFIPPGTTPRNGPFRTKRTSLEGNSAGNRSQPQPNEALMFSSGYYSPKNNGSDYRRSIFYLFFIEF